MTSDSTHTPDTPRWLHALAVLTALLTLPLLFLGAGVTSHGVGMVDPQGFRPPWEIVNGLLENSGLDWRLEYGHRTFGFLVGMCGIGLAVGCWFGDRRPWMGWIGLLALGLICTQGALGIFRVDYNALHGRTFALIHGVFAQIVFATLVSVAVLTSRRWTRGAGGSPAHPGNGEFSAGEPPAPRANDDGESVSPALKRWSIATALLVFAQLLVGGMVRHHDSLVGPRGHLLGAFVVVAAVVWLLKLIRESEVRERFTAARILFMALLALQLLLGMESWLAKYFVATSVTHEAIVPVPMHAEWVRTLHYVVGSMIFATSVSVAILAQRKPATVVEATVEHSRRLEGVLWKTTTAYADALPLVRSRWLDFLELTKPRISVMVLFTVAIGALLAYRAPLDVMQLVHALLGTALVAAGASALNQWMERHTDALMRRTENRPLPAGRLTSAEVVVFGVALAGVGLIYMAALLVHKLPTLLTAATFVSYVFIYTPLKRRTTLNTLIGAVPGALPPVIGWTAMTGTLDSLAVVLFLIVFFWQVPHFLAIAWMYREDYARAGLKMLPALDNDGAATARQMLLYAIALIPVSLLPVWLHDAGAMYGFGVLGLGIYFLRSAWIFALEPSQPKARKVLHASLVYLPGVLAILLIESWIRYLLT